MVKKYTQEEFLKALQKAAEFKGGLDKITEPLVVTDEDGIILFVNDAVAKRTGFSLDEIIGNTPGRLWGSQHDEGFYRDMWNKIKVEKKYFKAPVINKRKDGSFYSCELSIYPILDDAGDILFFLSIESNFSDSI
jgi:PAS domain S-box-containing protein